MGDLGTARDLVSRVRFMEDSPESSTSYDNFSGRSHHRDSMLRHGILISKSMTPVLENRLQAICDRLLTPRDSITAFVYNSAEVQADCLIDSSETCVLRFTSGLINLMDEREFQFVAAHELGHFLLGHQSCSQYTGGESTESYMIQRARELSADRIGLLGVDNLDKSIRAIIKTASGLGDEFIRFDVSSFLSQTDFLSSPSKGESRNSTHPSMLMRCRALLWFSMAVRSLSSLSKISDTELKNIDSRVMKDLEKFVDGQVRLRKKALENNITIWKTCILVIHAGSFEREKQNRMARDLGAAEVTSLKSFFEMFSQSELLEEANSRLNQSLAEAYSEFPSSAKAIEHAGFSRAYKILQ